MAPAVAKIIVGKPGTTPITMRTPPTTMNSFGRLSSWVPRSVPRPASEPLRVTSTPVAIEMRRALISFTRPSPTVRTVYVVRAAPMSMPFCRTPTVRPPTMLTTMITRAATASPLTNLEAPSIAP